METTSKTDDTDRPIGYASHLKRFGASLADHHSYSRKDFVFTLADCHHKLGIEWHEESLQTVPNEAVEEIEEFDTKIEWKTLECPKCHRRVEDTRKLTDHLVEFHGKSQDKLWYSEFKTIGSDVKRWFDKAVKRQAESSLVKKKFNNSNNMLICPADSKLAPFLMIKHLEVYFEELAAPATDGIALNIVVDEKSYPVIFSFHKVDKVRRRIKRSLVKKSFEKRLKVLENHCARVSILDEDVIFKKSRTAEEHKALAQALQLPETCSYEEIVNKITEMRAKHDDLNSVYSKSVKPDGQKMSAEEKRLISSLTNDMVTPVSGKRKTTYKIPSELGLGATKKRQRTTTPE
ncbi:hypothetical protein CRE_10073 [Caenorhabditis remanei]|uniref:C2H2-type domain-containing protein n=1 Tax=Caenorhabditis remanei TaxID=31234 RepID=E3M617_CAERE|nr:hypothetical protein CRE_10073 [Caenorhabditis remanei]